MKTLILISLFVSAFLAQGVAAQSIPEKLDALFDEAGLNGNVLVAEHGRIVYQKSFGYADIATKLRNTPDAAFQTASMSKIFTATAVLQLRDNGKLSLDDPLVTYLREFPFPNITIRHLLSHTSGLPDLEMYEPLVRQQPDLVISNKDVIPALKLWNKPLKFQPGEKWNYCNTNYVLLALLVETVSRMPFQEYLRIHIFEPAGMSDTYVRVRGMQPESKPPVTAHILATMYKTVPEAVETVRLKDPVRMRRIKFETYNLAATLGDQNVISTTGDLLKFDRALNAGKLLKQTSLDEAYAPTKLANGEIYYDDFGPQYGKCSYGLGWIVCDSPHGKTVSHDGFNRGIATQFYRNLTKKQTVVMFDNTEAAGFNEKVAAVINVLNGTPANLKLRQSIARAFGGVLLEKGPEAALITFNELRANPGYSLNEREMNLLGYEFLFNDYKPQSLEVFRLNVLLFPESFNVYDSYAEALEANGKRAEAILMYRKAIALNPKSQGSIDALKRLEAEKK